MDTKFNNLILQWGIFDPVTGNTVVTLIYPIAYSTATSYIIIKNVGLNYGSGNVLYQAMGFYNLSATEATTMVQAAHTQNNISSARWISIGY